MIVYNVTDTAIFITSKWRKDPSGGPAIAETQHYVAPGHGIDLSIVGLEPKATSGHRTQSKSGPHRPKCRPNSRAPR